MNGGVSLTIMPLLSLGANQEETLWSCLNGSAGKIIRNNLDKIRSLVEQQQIIGEIKNISVDSHTTTVFLFSSSQALVK
jgi:hypothetical protein